ncbi:SRPBCC family protein [Comamonas sp. lk]|uniref:SRPBCC family protein n=1 Tax=Comamonas sp. lk TaxID=2201272 RepID=UPI000EB24A89|nr:SRPBCC family protein [Comamonas sp. lk]
MSACALLVRWVIAGLLWICSASWAQELNIETSGQNGVITVNASATMRVQLSTAWSVISDYDHLAEFIPYMSSSRVVQRNGEQLLVEQTGALAFLFFQQSIEVRLAVTEVPPLRITARAVGGNLKEMSGSYTLEALPSGEVRLSYSASLRPDFAVPPVVGTLVVRNVLARQFTAMVDEIVRRDAKALR